MPILVSCLIAVLTLSLFFSSAGHAVTAIPKNIKTTNSVGLSPVVGGLMFSSSQDLKTAPMYGLRLSYDHVGKNIVDSIGIEGTVIQFSTTTKLDAKKADGLMLRADAVYSLYPRSKWVPFFALGAGGISIDREGVRDNSPFLNFGLGVKYFLEDYLAIRADARQLMVYSNVDTDKNFELSTGLTYYFGKERKKKTPPAPPKPKKPSGPAIPSIEEPPPAPQAAPVSIFDILGAAGAAALGFDIVPPQFQPVTPPQPARTPALVYRSTTRTLTGEEVVGQKSAPAEIKGELPGKKVAPAATETPVAKAAPGKVPVPKQAPVVTEAPVPKAEPLVTEAPVPKAEPLVIITPEPKPEPLVTIAPAPKAEPLVTIAPVPKATLPPAQLEPVVPSVQAEPPRRLKKPVQVKKSLTIEFIFSSSTVRPIYSSKIAELAAMMTTAQESSALVEGHTDSVGKSRPNVILSQRRAQNVKNELLRYGIDPERITVKGYGYTKPKASNKTNTGRQRNRRAVAVITVVK